jgi:hypothetical protein
MKVLKFMTLYANVSGKEEAKRISGQKKFNEFPSFIDSSIIFDHNGRFFHCL